jgi:putative membrane protein
VSSASSPTPPIPHREPGVEDATRRTRLANERTYLAWWRTSLAAVAVAVGVGRIVPGIAKTTAWPYELLGAGYGVLAVAFLFFAYARTRDVETALSSGGFAPLSQRVMLGLALGGAVLVVATVVVLIAV